MITNIHGDILFTDKELACPHCHHQQFNTDFESQLGLLRTAFGHPMPLTSAARCLEHNTNIGGHPNSLHLLHGGRGGGACAVDLYMIDGTLRALLIQKALNSGWSVGIASNFIHLDHRTRYHGLEQRVFHYTR